MKVSMYTLASSQVVRYSIIIAAASLPLILAALHVTHAGISKAPGTY
ncbi:hypothetical protein J5U23_01864 [Saccharolobus shibatae B12]|uniref:Uncharacterized protein n=1 Tax=Saccharolobus shibatae (strain ATCC 51178 / DSM 5389 / JCM 8931 / NBRC 15437 / B12) TaxID=523848 RepID=A0A8F5GTK6_SACSH|nr:hypothetical protein [Saccharolobus shibatae]QXJ28995.1 hypothetical protein J5U23_01864 [Saccharolobus shibatae B12]